MGAVAETRSIAYSAETVCHAGRVVCQVVRGDSGDRNDVAFSIAVRNDTGSDAHVLAVVPSALDVRHRTVVQSVVGAYSHFSTTIQLEVERYGETPELQVQLSGADINLALVVPSARAASATAQNAGSGRAIAALARAKRTGPAGVPARGPAPSAPVYLAHQRQIQWEPLGSAAVGKARTSPSAVPMVAVFMAVTLVAAFAVSRPHVGELKVPQLADAGRSVPIAYVATGIGAVTYNVIGRNADSIAGGTLVPGSGTFTIMLPTDNLDQAYLVRVSMIGIFGAALAEEYVKVAAPPRKVAAAPVVAPRPPAPPEIRSLALDRAALAGGDTLNVYYDVSATSGTVALVDPGSQITYGKSDISSAGRTAFVAPNVQGERFLNVVVTVRRGPATSVSRIAVTVGPATAPTSPASAEGFHSAPTDSIGTVLPVVLAAKTARSAQPIRVEVRNGVAGLVLTLTDDDGEEIAHREITATSSSTVFMAPTVQVPTRIRLQATYPQGSGTETIVQSINVTP